MRVLVDWRTHAAGSPEVTQVEKVPPSDEAVAINAKYALPIVHGTDFEVTDADYVLPIDGADISSRSYAHLLAEDGYDAVCMAARNELIKLKAGK